MLVIVIQTKLFQKESASASKQVYLSSNLCRQRVASSAWDGLPKPHFLLDINGTVIKWHNIKMAPSICRAF